MLNIGKIFSKLVKNSSNRELDRLKHFIQKINDLESQFQRLSQTKIFQQKLLNFNLKLKKVSK